MRRPTQLVIIGRRVGKPHAGAKHEHERRRGLDPHRGCFRHPPPTQDEPPGEDRAPSAFAFSSAAHGIVLAPGGVAGQTDQKLRREQSQEALNFNISVVIGAVVCWILVFVLIGFRCSWRSASRGSP